MHTGWKVRYQLPEGVWPQGLGDGRGLESLQRQRDSLFLRGLHCQAVGHP